MVPATTKGKTKGYIRGLDGLRAVAIIFVVLYHVAPKYVPGGYIGVDLFFVLSGFLITTLITEEYLRRGRLDVRAFWIRRARRLLPALLLVVGVVCTAVLFIGGDMLVGIGRQLLGAVTFSSNWTEIAAGTNYFDASTPHLFSNFWSLAVEEQFYITWPLIVVLLLKMGKRGSLKTALWVSGSMSLLSAGFMAMLYLSTQNATRVYYGLDTHLFGLMGGAALAFYRLERVRQKGTMIEHLSRMKWGVNSAIAVMVVSMGALAAWMADTTNFPYEGGLALAAGCSVILVAALIYMPTKWMGLFEVVPLRWIGKRSYGIYLWHWPLIVIAHQIAPTMDRMASAGLATLSAVVMAAFSYRFVELPVRHQGIWQYVRRGFIRDVQAASELATKWRVRPHPALPFVVLIIVATFATVVTAPTVTQAERQVELGQQAIARAEIASHAAAVQRSRKIIGSDITVIGDSVALASAPALEQTFPGIMIDAKVSRSMRGGGLETIENYLQSGTMRRVVVVALGTNGNYGVGNIDRTMRELGQRRSVIFVTAHAPDQWSIDNNAELHQVKPLYKNMYIAEWDAAITPHPELLAPDGIHPGMAGGELYADCIKTAIGQIEQGNVV